MTRCALDTDLYNLIERILADIAQAVAAYQAGRLPLPAWRAAMAETLSDGHRAAYLLGADVRALSPQAKDFLARTIADQLGYLKGFVADVRAGRVSDALMAARATLYAGALKATYSRAKFWAWPLPFHPADGETPCLVNCTCAWRGENLDAAKGDGDFYWDLATHAHAENCPGCIERMHDGAPYLVRKGTLQ